MEDKIITAIIAGSVSLVVASLSFLATMLQLRNNSKKMQKEIDHAFSGKLYEQRIRVYPKGFKISGYIVRRKKPQFFGPPDKLKEICKQLIEWAEEESGLYMSGKTIEAYYNLRSCLLSNPGNGEHYTVRQAEKLWEARVMFRQQLRKDIGIMHQSEKQIKF